MHFFKIARCLSLETFWLAILFHELDLALNKVQDVSYNTECVRGYYVKFSFLSCLVMKLGILVTLIKFSFKPWL